jgi:glycosyltransferase involved in cell wall biosynthesis
MKILQVYKSYNPTGGGVERHIDGICKTLDTEFQSTVIAKKLPKENLSGINYNIVKFSFIRFITEINNCNLIHLHGARSILNLPFFILGKILNKKIIYTPHCYYDSKEILTKFIKKMWDFTIEKMFYKFSNFTILLNDYWLDYAKSENYNVENVKIIPNCIIKGNYKRVANLLHNKQIKDIISISRIDKVKRIEDIIKVVINKSNKFNLHIVGIGPDLEKLKKKYGNINNIKFYGYLEDEEIDEILKNIDVFIIPSEKEGLPTTILEMILKGIPVLASKIPGNISILKNLNEKLNFNIGDLNEISRILENEQFNINPELLKNVIKDFTWENRIKDIEEIYCE